MSATVRPHSVITALMADHREIRSQLLPALVEAVWDLELAYGADDEDLGRVREALDELQADVGLHYGEEAEFLMPLVSRLDAGEQLSVEELDRLSAVIGVLARRHDDFDGEIAAIRDQVLAAMLPTDAEEDRAAILEQLDTLLERLRRHDRTELEQLFPATLANVHAQLVARDEAEDQALGWA